MTADLRAQKKAVLDADERKAMDHLLAFMKHLRKWGMDANQTELAMAIHTLQGFVVQHMLHRLAPDCWSSWKLDRKEQK